MQLKKLIYERTQRKHETLRSYSRALLDLVQKLSDKVDRNEMLCEVFSDNVQDKYLRVELKKKLREEPSLTFIQLREYALQISEEDADCCSSSVKPEVMQVQYGDSEKSAPVESKGEMSAIGRLEAQVSNLANLQQQMLEVLGQLTLSANMSNGPVSTNIAPTQFTQSPAPQSVMSGSTKSGFRHQSHGNMVQNRGYSSRPPLSSIQCHYCHEYGHYKSGCPRRNKPRQPGMGSTGEGSGPQARGELGNMGTTGPGQVAGNRVWEGN